MQKFKIYLCIFCTQTIIVRSNSWEEREEKKRSFKKTSIDHETVFFFYLSCCLYQGSNYKYFLDMVKSGTGLSLLKRESFHVHIKKFLLFLKMPQLNL